LSSSIFGGLVVGGIVAYLYNRFKNIQLPKMIGFFSGVRFIPIVTFGTMCVVGMLFAMVWPIFGIGLFDFGQALSKGGKYGGVTTLAFGILNRALLPFGLHHVMDIMMQFTTVGGSFDTSKHFYAT
jgi:PTS system glucose-specific IIC component